MDSAKQIRINELLLEREELFLRIHQLETKAAELLGEPYPFVRPVLPSDQKPRRKAPAGRGRENAPAKPVQLRMLEAEEKAYRVVYEQYGKREEELHYDVGAIGNLMASQGATLSLLSVEAVDKQGQVTALLFGASGA